MRVAGVNSLCVCVCVRVSSVHHLVAGRQQLEHGVAADVADAAGDEHGLWHGRRRYS